MTDPLTNSNIHQPPQDLSHFQVKDFIGDLFKAFSNRNYLFLMLTYFSLSLMLGVRGLSTYMNICYWELKSEDIGTLIFAGSLFGYVVGFLFAARLHGKYDKRIVIVITAVTLSVFPAVPVILRIAGIFPDNGSFFLLWSLVGFQALGSMSGSILNISVVPELTDIADELELKHGLRQEGIIWWLGVIDSPLTIIPGLIAAGFYAQYRINKSSYEKTRAALTGS